MNRDDYMAGRVDHQTFYLAVCDAIGRETIEKIVRYGFTVAEIREALKTDEHLNDLELARWDRLHPSVMQAVKENGRATMEVSWSAKSPLATGYICWSLSESVCVLKAAARRLATEGQWVLYRDEKLVGIFATEVELWDYLHHTHSSSVSHLFKYEGYTATRPSGESYEVNK